MLSGLHFGTGVRAAADLTLLLELAMGFGLLAGAALARAGKFRLHALCQSAIVIFNLGLIGLMMVPSFTRQIAPQIPSGLGKFYYWIAAAHATLGSIAEVSGLYILLAAGTKLLPERLRLRRYKLWMRIVLALWWVVLALGGLTYARWYWPRLFR